VTTVLLVRHGATDWNLEARAQGQADIPLNERGRGEAAAVASRLAERRVAAVYSSDLVRALETAETIARCHGVGVRRDRDLREIDQGEWTGLVDAEIRRRWPDRAGPARHYSARPGGESPRAVRTRALRALRRVVEEHPEETVVVVSHGVAIRTLVAESLGYDEVESARLRGLVNGGVVCLDARLRDGKLLLSGLQRLDGRSPDREDPNQ
jgi:broad specificity phosphatase PhoE